MVTSGGARGGANGEKTGKPRGAERCLGSHLNLGPEKWKKLKSPRYKEISNYH